MSHDAVLLAAEVAPELVERWRAGGVRVARLAPPATAAELLSLSRDLEVDPSDTLVIAADDVTLGAAARARYPTLDLRAGEARVEERRRPEDLPSALGASLPEGPVAVFLDYDGTLAPIVPHPDRAFPAAGMVEAVAALAAVAPVCVVSGRDRPDVERFVGLDLTYAGSHGFDIRGPGVALEHPEGVAALPDLDRAEAALRERLAAVEGALVERKRFSVAVHHRRVGQQDVPIVMAAVEGVLDAHPRLRRSGGKKVVELQPDVDWHKGRAVTWLIDALGITATPIYVGDDRTDEDAFRALEGRGLGIVVGRPSRPTSAHLRLEDTDEVRAFLHRLATR